jgi:4-amino-4-deoxy-L-arabinose transferase-like glycosyltransferase
MQDNGKSTGSMSSRFLPWAVTLLTLLACLPPLFVKLGAPDPVRMMEATSFVTSQETWLRIQNGQPDAWKMPSQNGRPRIEKPPLLVWMNLLAWTGLDSEKGTVAVLAWRSRMLAAGMGIMTLLAVFWAGASLGGWRLGNLAMLITGSSYFFIHQARYATYDTHLMGWATAAVAAGLWALLAPPERLGRYVTGWVLSSLALAAAALTKGPVAFGVVLGPLAVATLLSRDQRRRNLLGLLASIALPMAVTIAWFVIAAKTADNATARLSREYMFIFEAFKNPLFYLSLFGLVFPWTLWLLAATARPLARNSDFRSRDVWITWGWMICLLVLITLSPIKNKRYIAPVLPAAGLLAAQGWYYLQDLADRGRTPRWAEIVRRIHWIVLMVVSVAFPIFAVLQERLVAAGCLHRVDFPGLNATIVVIVGAALLALSVAGLRAHARGRVIVAAAVTGAWMLVLSTMAYSSYAASPRFTFPHRADAEQLAGIAARQPVFYLSTMKELEAAPSNEFLIFYRGIMPSITLPKIAERAASHERFTVLVRVSTEDEAALGQMGLTYSGEIRDGHEPPWKLYERP